MVVKKQNRPKRKQEVEELKRLQVYRHIDHLSRENAQLSDQNQVLMNFTESIAIGRIDSLSPSVLITAARLAIETVQKIESGERPI